MNTKYSIVSAARQEQEQYGRTRRTLKIHKMINNNKKSSWTYPVELLDFIDDFYIDIAVNSYIFLWFFLSKKRR